MAVNGLFSALIGEVEDLSDVILENIWSLAERSSDQELMLSILRDRKQLPAAVLASAKASKSSDIRVSYLCRSEVDADERSELLASERRADVFAGLVGIAKKDPDLARRLYDQFVKKPTKVLARVMLRQGLSYEDLLWRSTLLVINDKSLPQQLEQAITSVIEEASSDPAKVAEILPVVPDRFLHAIRFEKVVDENLLALVERLKETAVRDIDRWDYSQRRGKDMAASALVRIASRQEIPADVLARLDAFSGMPEVPTSQEIAALLAARLACGSESVDKRQLTARNATGKKVDDLFHMAFTGNPNDVQPIVQGLLENPEAWKSERFAGLLHNAKPVSLIRAMATTRSTELLMLIWDAKLDSTPAECWQHVDDVEAVHLGIVRRETDREDHHKSIGYSSMSSRITSLLQFDVSKSVVAEIPFRLFCGTRYNSWAARSIIRNCSTQVVELQKEFLGADPSAWENFNNLASDWSGTLGELLEAAKNL